MAEQAEITKRASTLPPDYVSLAQLREKWLLKQQKQKELETKQNAILKDQETGFTNGNQLENQIENKKKRSNNKSRNNRKKKQLFVDGKLENHQNDFEFVSEIGKRNETEIVPKTPIEETSGVSQKNGINGAGNSAKVSRAKFVDETKSNNSYNKRGNRKRVGGNWFGNNEVENHVESIKGSEKSKSLNEMGKSEVLAVGEKLDGLKVKESDGFQRKDDSVVGVEINDEKLVENGAKDDESVKSRNAVGKYGNGSGNVGRKFRRHPGFGDRRLGNNRTVGGNVSEKSEAEMHDESSKGGEKGKDSEDMSKSEVLEVGVKVDGDGFQRKDDSVVGVEINDEKLVENGAKDDESVKTRNAVGKYGNRSGNVGRKFRRRPGFGDRRLGNNRTVGGNVSEKSEAEMLDESIKGGEKGKDSEDIRKSEVLEVGVKLEGDGFQRKDDSVVGVELNDEKSVENRAKDDEKVEAKNGLGRYWNRNGNGRAGRKFGGPAFGNRRRVGGNRSERSEAEMLVKSSKGDDKGKDSEEMGKSEVLDVGVKLDCLKLIDSNGSQGKDDSLVGVGLNDDQIVGTENRAKDDEKGKAGNELGKYRNGSGNVGRRNYTGNAVGNRNYGGSGRLGAGRMKQSGNVKVWVKKEDKSGANLLKLVSLEFS